MIHHANPDFWACYRGLPSDVRTLADKAFALLQQNPRHPSLLSRNLATIGRPASAPITERWPFRFPMDFSGSGSAPMRNTIRSRGEVMGSKAYR